MGITLGLFASVAILLGAAVAEADISQAFAQIPTCTQECGLKVLTPAQCQLNDLPSCLCTNTTLQRDLALCVVVSCSLEDQAVSTTILQNDVCIGVPQPSRSAEIIRDVAIIASVTFPIICLRFISRSLVASRMWWDDWAVGLAAILMIPMTIIPIMNATRGFGKHFWDVSPQNTLLLRKLYYVSQILYVVVQGLAKFSILFLYLRIFLHKGFRLVLKLAIGWMMCQTVAFVIVVSFQCTPIKSVWDITVQGKCINSQAFVYSAAAFSIFEDFVIMLLPIWELKALKLDLRKRVALGFMFALGSFACITSMIRLKYIISYGTSIDLTFDNVDVIIWSVLEAFTAIICACLMCLRPLLIRFLPALFPASKASESRPTPNPSWAQAMGSKLASKLRTGNNGLELQSEDDGDRVGQPREIRVQKSWVTKTSIELQDRSPSIESRVNA